MNRNLVYKFQEKDDRDFTFKIDKHPKNDSLISTIKKRANTVSNPVIKSLSAPDNFIIPKLSSILDQGNLGDCVANAFKYTVSAQTNKNLQLSRLFLYAICRILDNTSLDQDTGTTIRTAGSALLNYGVATEYIYAYNINLFSNFPPLSVFQISKKLQKFSYIFVNQDLLSIKNCLYVHKTPIIFGFIVYDSFMSSIVLTTGIVPMPDLTNEIQQGGHCMCIVGYNDSTQMFKCANSWGTSWGNAGYCYIPYNYLLNSTLASDFCYLDFIY